MPPVPRRVPQPPGFAGWQPLRSTGLSRRGPLQPGGEQLRGTPTPRPGRRGTRRGWGDADGAAPGRREERSPQGKREIGVPARRRGGGGGDGGIGTWGRRGGGDAPRQRRPLLLRAGGGGGGCGVDGKRPPHQQQQQLQHRGRQPQEQGGEAPAGPRHGEQPESSGGILRARTRAGGRDQRLRRRDCGSKRPPPRAAAAGRGALRPPRPPHVTGAGPQRQAGPRCRRGEGRAAASGRAARRVLLRSGERAARRRRGGESPPPPVRPRGLCGGRGGAGQRLSWGASPLTPDGDGWGVPRAPRPAARPAGRGARVRRAGEGRARGLPALRPSAELPRKASRAAFAFFQPCERAALRSILTPLAESVKTHLATPAQHVTLRGRHLRLAILIESRLHSGAGKRQSVQRSLYMSTIS